MYRDTRGRLRSAGTFTRKQQANFAWKEAEVGVAKGRVADPRRGRQTFQRYVEREWLPNHVIEVSTREGYTYQINKHILPWFGRMRMVEVLPAQVREWISELSAGGVSPATITNLRAIISAIFTTALNDQVTFLHPCKGVKIPTVPVKPHRIITPEQFDTIYRALSQSADEGESSSSLGGFVLSWTTMVYGGLLSALLAAVLVAAAIRPRRFAVIATAAAGALLGPWLGTRSCARHTAPSSSPTHPSW